MIAKHTELCVIQGRRDGSSQDDAFAWQSREFLRQLCIGQVSPVIVRLLLLSLAGTQPSTQGHLVQACTFKVDYVLENIPGREFGSVFIGNTPENVALSVAAKGWARVRLLACKRC